jgi:integrase
MITTHSSASTLDAAIAAFMDEKRTGNFAPDHIRTLRGRLLQFARFMRGSTRIEAVTREDILRYLPPLGSPRTQVNHLGSIRLLFGWAQKAKGWLPMDRIPAPNTISIQADEHDPEFYTCAELRQLLRAACNLPREHRGVPIFIIISAFCGLRTKEMMRLRWGDILFDKGVIKLSSLVTKTSRRRAVPIPANAVEWLTHAMESTPPAGLVVPARLHSNFHRLTGAVAEAAGMAWKLNGLRHSFGTYAMAQHQNAALVSEIMGNSPKVLQTSYKGLALLSDAEEWFGITPDNTL